MDLKNKKSLFIAIGIIVFAVIIRLFLTSYSIYDAAPFAAIAIFGAVFFKNKKLALILPLIAWFISDLILNQTLYAAYNVAIFNANQIFSATALILIVGLGYWWFKKFKIKLPSIAATSFLAALVFFIISNFGVWLSSGMYIKNFAGLIECYIAGIPFFRTAIIGNFLYLFTMVEVYKFVVSRNMKLA